MKPKAMDTAATSMTKQYESTWHPPEQPVSSDVTRLLPSVVFYLHSSGSWSMPKTTYEPVPSRSSITGNSLEYCSSRTFLKIVATTNEDAGNRPRRYRFSHL